VVASGAALAKEVIVVFQRSHFFQQSSKIVQRRSSCSCNRRRPYGCSILAWLYDPSSTGTLSVNHSVGGTVEGSSLVL